MMTRTCVFLLLIGFAAGMTLSAPKLTKPKKTAGPKASASWEKAIDEAESDDRQQSVNHLFHKVNSLLQKKEIVVPGDPAKTSSPLGLTLIDQELADVQSIINGERDGAGSLRENAQEIQDRIEKLEKHISNEAAVSQAVPSVPKAIGGMFRQILGMEDAVNATQLDITRKMDTDVSNAAEKALKAAATQLEAIMGGNHSEDVALRKLEQLQLRLIGQKENLAGMLEAEYVPSAPHCKDLPRGSPALQFKELTCEFIEEHLVDDHLFLTFADGQGIDLVRPWAQNLRKALGVNADSGVGPFVVALDDDAVWKLGQLAYNENLQLPHFLAGNMTSAQGKPWTAVQLKEAGQIKAKVLQQLVQMGSFHIVLSDADVMWLNNPIKLFKEQGQDVDVLAATAQTGSPLLVEEKPQKFIRKSNRSDDITPLMKDAKGQIMSCVLVVKGQTAGTKMFAERWLREMMEQDIPDQRALQRVLRGEVNKPVDYDVPRNLKATNGIVWGLLNPAQFMSGQSYFVAELHRKLDVKPFMVHVDNSIGLQSKLLRLESRGLSEESDDYYAGKFLVFDFHLPEDMLQPYEDINVHFEAPDRHMQLVDYQLKQLAHAAAIAHGLNRTLVIPEFKGLCEWVQWPVQNAKCRFPADGLLGKDAITPTEMPYQIPPDQIFKAQALAKVPHRWASSFFASKRNQLGREDVVVVSREPSGNTQVTEVLVKDPKPTMNSITEALVPDFWDTPIVKLNGNPVDLFNGFDEQKVALEFKQKVGGATNAWCCSNANMADGPISYRPLEQARETWWVQAKGPMKVQCIADREVVKTSNALNFKRRWADEESEEPQWWGASYPVTAEEMCSRRANPEKCKSTSKGLCMARPGMDLKQKDTDTWEQELRSKLEEKYGVQSSTNYYEEEDDSEDESEEEDEEEDSDEEEDAEDEEEDEDSTEDEEGADESEDADEEEDSSEEDEDGEAQSLIEEEDAEDDEEEDSEASEDADSDEDAEDSTDEDDEDEEEEEEEEEEK